MSDHSHDSTDNDSEASSDRSWGALCGGWYCQEKTNVVCLDCCYRTMIKKLCRKCSKDRHPGKLADIHHRITLRSQVTSQRVSFSRGEGEHNSSHKFSNRRYVCDMINNRESCEGEATVACLTVLDCSLFLLHLKCSTCDISDQTFSKVNHRYIYDQLFSKVNHRRIRLHPVSTDDVREGSSTAAGSDGDGECGDSTSRMEEDGGESYGKCDECYDEAVEACLDCDVYTCHTLGADCDIKRHTQKPMATHCRIPIERFQPMKLGHVEVPTKTFHVPNDTFYVCASKMNKSECEGKARCVVFVNRLGLAHPFCYNCYKQKLKDLEEFCLPCMAILLHYQDSVPNVEHENISLQQDSDETNLENNTNETTPQFSMEHQIRTAYRPTPRNTDEIMQSYMIAESSDGTIIREDLGTTRQVSSWHKNSKDVTRKDEEVTQNPIDGRDSDHEEGSHYKCDRCDRPAHSVCMDCDRNLNQLCQQCFKTHHNTPARKRHKTLEILCETTSTRASPVKITDLGPVHDRYRKLLEYRRLKSWTRKEIKQAIGIAPQTLMDRIGIAELRIVDEQTYYGLEKIAIETSYRSKFTVKDFEMQCREELKKHRELVGKMRTDGKLLPVHIQAYKTQ